LLKWSYLCTNCYKESLVFDFKNNCISFQCDWGIVAAKKGQESLLFPMLSCRKYVAKKNSCVVGWENTKGKKEGNMGEFARNHCHDQRSIGGFSNSNPNTHDNRNPIATNI